MYGSRAVVKLVRVTCHCRGAEQAQSQEAGIMPKNLTHELNDDAKVFLQALINELQARDQFTRLTRHLRETSDNQTDVAQCYRDLCIARRSIQLAERKHYRAYRNLIRHFEL